MEGKMKHPQAWRLPNYNIQTAAPDPKVEVCGHFHGRFLGGIDTSLFQTSLGRQNCWCRKSWGTAIVLFCLGRCI